MLTDEIAAFLVEKGLASGANVDVFYADNAATPDTCLILQVSAGPAPERLVALPLYEIEHPALSITVRDANDRGAAYFRAENLIRALGTVSNRPISGVWYLYIRPSHSSPISLPDDEHNRPEYTVNFDVGKYPSPLS